MAATESQDHRFDLLPNRIVNIVFSVVSLFIMFLPGLSWGVGASGLRGKLILAVVLLVVGVVGISRYAAHLVVLVGISADSNLRESTSV